MNRLLRFGTAATLALASTLALSQGAPSPEAQAKSAVEARQAVFKLIANQNGPLSGLTRNQAVDAGLAARNAERIQVLAGMIPELFERDTREFKSVNTAALDGIWNSQAEFKTKADALATAAGKLAAASKANDRAGMTTAAGEIGRACGSCHDAFRAKPAGR
jgi:cytochrome c556